MSSVPSPILDVIAALCLETRRPFIPTTVPSRCCGVKAFVRDARKLVGSCRVAAAAVASPSRRARRGRGRDQMKPPPFLLLLLVRPAAGEHRRDDTNTRRCRHGLRILRPLRTTCRGVCYASSHSGFRTTVARPSSLSCLPRVSRTLTSTTVSTRHLSGSSPPARWVARAPRRPGRATAAPTFRP